MASRQQNEHESYRVIVLGRRGTEILLVPSGERHMLPWVEIPRWQRVAENLTVALKSDWGEEVVCLFEPTTELPPDGLFAGYQAAEHLNSCGYSKMPTRWVPLSTLRQDSLIEAPDYLAIKQVVGVCNRQIEGTSAGRFARLGWFSELRNWIESVIEPMGLHLNGRFRQLNASASFSLVRFETEGPAMWFKAVGEPNLREFGVTSVLAQLFPEYLPPLVATRRDWNGWLSNEVEGKLLSDVQEHAPWEQATAALARLQIKSIDRGPQILGAGVHDLGSLALSRLIHPFLSVVAQLMERQKKVPPAVLGHEDLLALADCLQSAVDATEATGIPETLGHLDLNPGNIIVSTNKCAFLDWVEAFVGNPLFSLDYLLQHARRAFGEDSDVRTKMIAAYCTEWSDVLSEAAIADALAFAPLLAVFACAVGNDRWREPHRLDEPTAGYLRSLARRMYRESRKLADRRTLCPQ